MSLGAAVDWLVAVATERRQPETTLISDGIGDRCLSAGTGSSPENAVMPGGSDPVRRAGFRWWSLHRDLLQEALDLAAQVGGGLLDRLGGRQHGLGRAARLGRGAGDLAEHGDDLLGALAALATFCEISPVAAFCCCTEAATAAVNWLISCMRSAMRRIASTAAPVEACTAAIWPAISSVAFAVCTASDFTSEATTAKPRPASPARAASMVALSASRLVCPATSWISLTTSPIFCAACASPPIWSLVAPRLARPRCRRGCWSGRAGG